MRGILILLVFLLFGELVYAQGDLKEHVFYGGWKIKIGDTILLGNGCHKDGFFENINTAIKPYKPMLPAYAGTNTLVLYEYYDESRRVKLKLRSTKGEEFYCQADVAIQKKELIPPANYWNYHKNLESAPMAISGFVKTNGMDKTQLLEIVNKWVSTNLANMGSTIDTATGILIARASFPYHSNISLGNDATKGQIEFIVRVLVSAKGYDYTFTDFTHNADNNNHPDIYRFGLLTIDKECPLDKIYAYHGVAWSNKVWDELKHITDSTAQVYVLSLKNAANNK